MKNSKSQKLSLGVFVIVSTALLIAALYFIGNRQNLFGKTFKVITVFKNVNGLQDGNNVRYSGINVGTVKNIEMINDTTISVSMIIENKILVHLKKNAIATIGSDGLVGSMIINILPAYGVSEPLIPGDTIKSFSKLSTNDMLTTLNNTNENAALLTADLLKITKAINNGEGTLGLLISDQATARNLKSMVVNLNRASITASTTMNEVKKVVDAINYDESLAAIFLSDTLSTNKMEHTIEQLEQSTIGINKIVTNVDSLVTELRSSSGLYNAFVNDTILSNSVENLLLNLQNGSLILNEDLKALQENFLLKKYFRKQKRKEKKE